MSQRKLNIVASLPASTHDTAQSRNDLSEADLHELLTAFYDIVTVDPLLGRYFEHIDMHAHMPRIVAFWATLVFDTHSYSGNAFKPHLEMPGLQSEHFARWVSTLDNLVDSRFAGPRAARMKFLAHRVAYSMQVRLGLDPFEGWRQEA